jgi:hypothetical protein
VGLGTIGRYDLREVRDKRGVIWMAALLRRELEMPIEATS